MAAVSGFESLKRPGRQDFVQFCALFPQLFEAASPEARRTAAAALSRLSYVPEEIAELLINQPVEIAAPFIAYYENLSEAALARAIARHGVGHARAAARRSDLSPAALTALWALKEPSIDRALKVRGLSVEDTFAAQIEIPAAAAEEAPALDPASEFMALPPLDELVSPDPRSEDLRRELRDMVARQAPGGGRTPQTAARRSDVHHMADLLAAARDFEFGETKRVLPQRSHLDRVARFAGSGDAHWFATALADAMDSSFSLAERIMLDLSGQQLAMAMLALGVPKSVIATALETYFPHLAERAQLASKAELMILALDPDECTDRLQAWLRADAYTNRRAPHVPVMAETRRERDRRDSDFDPRSVSNSNFEAPYRPGQRRIA
jgi:Uncharacterized protein conserved in bacteria